MANLPTWLLAAPYVEAEAAYHADRISWDQWQAYRAVWYYSAPRFSELVRQLPCVRDINSLLDRRIDPFTRGYLETALWLSDPDPRSGQWAPSDRWNVDAIDRGCMAIAIGECRIFQADHADLLAAAGDESQNGHDFWLTRNGHGVGYWDRGYGRIGDQLTTAAQREGERNCYGPQTNDQGTCDEGSGDWDQWDGVIWIE